MARYDLQNRSTPFGSTSISSCCCCCAFCCLQLIAADLLAQAEHDTDALPILVTTSEALIPRVEAELAKQLEALPTRETAAVSVSKGFVVLCGGREGSGEANAEAEAMEEAIRVCDVIAPEHLEVQVNDADKVWPKISNYGGMFVGSHSAEVFGDYGAGPNHVLPTSGTARYTGGLSVFTFLRIRTWLRSDGEEAAASSSGFDEVVADSAHLARLEGLFGHENAALVRGRGGK